MVRVRFVGWGWRQDEAALLGKGLGLVLERGCGSDTDEGRPFSTQNQHSLRSEVRVRVRVRVKEG